MGPHISPKLNMSASLFYYYLFILLMMKLIKCMLKKTGLMYFPKLLFVDN
jgi:hypothetical protein